MWQRSSINSSTSPSATRLIPKRAAAFFPGDRRRCGRALLNLAGGIFGVFTAIILTAYFIIDGEMTFEWAVSLFPAEQQPRLAATLLRAEKRMRNWLTGQAS